MNEKGSIYAITEDVLDGVDLIKLVIESDNVCISGGNFLYNNKDDLASILNIIDTSVNNIQISIQTLEDNFETLENNIINLDSSLDSLQNSIQTLEGNIDLSFNSLSLDLSNIGITNDFITRQDLDASLQNINTTQLDISGDASFNNVDISGILKVNKNIIEYIVTASGSDYYINNIKQPTLTLDLGKTYKFNLEDSTNNTHSFTLYTDNNIATRSIYNTNVTLVDQSCIEFSVTNDISYKTLYYDCSNHSYMGGKINIIKSSTDLITMSGSVDRNRINIDANNMIYGTLELDAIDNLNITDVSITNLIENAQLIIDLCANNFDVTFNGSNNRGICDYKINFQDDISMDGSDHALITIRQINNTKFLNALIFKSSTFSFNISLDISHVGFDGIKRIILKETNENGRIIVDESYNPPINNVIQSINQFKICGITALAIFVEASNNTTYPDISGTFNDISLTAIDSSGGYIIWDGFTSGVYTYQVDISNTITLDISHTGLDAIRRVIVKETDPSGLILFDVSYGPLQQDVSNIGTFTITDVTRLAILVEASNNNTYPDVNGTFNDFTLTSIDSSGGYVIWDGFTSGTYTYVVDIEDDILDIEIAVQHQGDSYIEEVIIRENNESGDELGEYLSTISDATVFIAPFSTTQSILAIKANPYEGNASYSWDDPGITMFDDSSDYIIYSGFTSGSYILTVDVNIGDYSFIISIEYIGDDSIDEIIIRENDENGKAVYNENESPLLADGDNLIINPLETATTTLAIQATPVSGTATYTWEGDSTITFDSSSSGYIIYSGFIDGGEYTLTIEQV